MGVHVHREVEAGFQRRHQRRGGWCPQQPGHVLDRQDVRAGVDDLLGQPQVVVQGVEVLRRVAQVAGVAHRDFGDRAAGGTHGVDGRAHGVDVVECVEDPEDVDAGGGGLVDERGGDRLRVGGVADGVAPAQQHLQADVGHGGAQRGEPLPGVLFEESQRHVVGGPAPALHREQLGGHPRHVGGNLQQPVGAQPGGQQRLVGVAERGVGDRQRLLVAQRAGEFFRAQLDETLFGARRRRGGQADGRQLVVRVAL